MREKVKEIPEKFKVFWDKYTSKQKTIVIAIICVVLIAIGVVAWLASMTVSTTVSLYKGLDAYADVQRHGDAGQRVDVDVQVQEVVEDRRHEDIDGQRRGDDGQVAQVAAHGEDEREQDGDAEQRAQVDLLQFARDVFRGVVGDRKSVV